MAEDNRPTGAISEGEGNTPQEKPLQSWKEIAAYLDRDERTAQRWEKAEDLKSKKRISSFLNENPIS